MTGVCFCSIISELFVVVRVGGIASIVDFGLEVAFSDPNISASLDGIRQFHDQREEQQLAYCSQHRTINNSHWRTEEASYYQQYADGQCNIKYFHTKS